MDSLGLDLFQIGKNQYLLAVDRYSGFPLIVEKLNKLNTKAIIDIMEKKFNEYGWPRRIRSDNGPQYRSEFTSFCKMHNIVHETSSPHFSQSNGLSESAVKQQKFLMKKVKENLGKLAEENSNGLTPRTRAANPQHKCSSEESREQNYHICPKQQN